MPYNRNLYSSSESAIDAGMIYDQTKEKLQSEINAEVSSDITELDESLSTFVRPNLLVNWYFIGGGSQLGDGVFPINQRGEGSYEPNQGNTFLIDRWSTGLATGKLQLHTGSMSGTNNFLIEQSVGKVSDFGGKTLTISILTSQGLISSTDVCPTTAPASGTTNMRSADIYSDGSRVGYADVIVNTAGNVKARIRVFDGYIVYFWAIKLELGSTQTLAHQENGVWVLNEIPNWEEEYRKCYAPVKIRNADIDATSATYPSYGNTAGVLFYDKNSYALAMYADRHETDGSTGAIIGGNKRINNSNYWNYLRLLVKPDGTKVVMVTDPAAWRTALVVPADGEVLKKTGGTMTGNLSISSASPGVYLNNNTQDVTESSYTTFNDAGVRLRDKNNKNVVIFTDRYEADGRTGAWISGWKTVNGTDISNGLYLFVDKNGNRVVTVSDAAAWRNALNALNKSGDTMSGQLTVANASIIVQDKSIISGTTPSSNIYGKSYYLNDNNGFNVATLQIMSLADGREGFQLVANKKVNNTSKFNYLRMNVDADGNPSVEMNGAAAWRKALGLCYAANNTFTNSSIRGCGFVTTSTTEIYFTVNTPLSMENISTVTVTSLSGLLRGIKGYLNSVTTGTDFVTASGYTVTANKQTNTEVRVKIKRSSAFTNVDNNTPVAFDGSITLKFT